MEFSKRYIIQCLGHAASNIRLKGESLENLSLLKNYIHRFNNLETLFAEMKKITALSRIGIKLNELYLYASSDRVDFSTLSKEFTRQSAELTTPLMFLLNDNSTEKMNSYLAQIKEAQYHSSDTEESLDESSDSFESLLEQREKFNDIFISFIKELNIFLDEIKKNKIEDTEIKRYIVLIEEKVTLAETANLEIIARVLNCSIFALKFLSENENLVDDEFIEKIRSALIITVVVLRAKDIDLGLYLEEVEELERIVGLK